MGKHRSVNLLQVPYFHGMSKKSIFDSDVVKRAQQGDEKARNEILTALDPLLRAFFIKRIGRKPEVDDLVQNTLLRVHRGLADLKEHSSLKAFSMKAAIFELQDLYRGRYNSKESLLESARLPEKTHEGTMTNTRLDLEKALSTLSPKARQIIELREYGYRYEEIAKMIGSTEAAIKMQVKRAFEKLKNLLTVLLLAF